MATSTPEVSEEVNMEGTVRVETAPSSPSQMMGSGISPQSGGATSNQSTVVSQQVVESLERHDPLTSKNSVRNIQLKDVANVMRHSVKFSEVTMEQIERVRSMHDRFAENAQFSFNYNTLLLVASVLAALGLASDSGTTVIASMLVSPIMGPVVGIAYGATIHDKKLMIQSLKTELLSLVFCIVVGAIIGALCGWTDLGEDFPTKEMGSRATWQNFWVGLPIAFFSGLGVAVSLLDEQTSSLVGVAISASLLPPAVNSGIIWVAYGYYEKNWLGAQDGESLLESQTTETERQYTREQFRQGGGISLLLTVANIILIVISSMLMFRMKERLPIKKKVFWEDLGVARKIYQNRAVLATDEDIGIQTDPTPEVIQEEDEEQA